MREYIRFHSFRVKNNKCSIRLDDEKSPTSTISLLMYYPKDLNFNEHHDVHLNDDGNIVISFNGYRRDLSSRPKRKTLELNDSNNVVRTKINKSVTDNTELEIRVLFEVFLHDYDPNKDKTNPKKTGESILVGI